MSLLTSARKLFACHSAITTTQLPSAGSRERRQGHPRTYPRAVSPPRAWVDKRARDIKSYQLGLEHSNSFLFTSGEFKSFCQLKSSSFKQIVDNFTRKFFMKRFSNTLFTSKENPSKLRGRMPIRNQRPAPGISQTDSRHSVYSNIGKRVLPFTLPFKSIQTRLNSTSLFLRHHHSKAVVFVVVVKK